MSRQGECWRSTNSKPNTYEAVLADLDKVLEAYKQVLWLYAEGICRCNPDRFEYLMSVELPFYLKPEVLVDLELLVNHIVNEQRLGLKEAA